MSNIKDEILTAPKLSALLSDPIFASNVGRYAATHVSTAVDIAKSLPEDADEAAAILADAARFHAIIRNRKASAVFANLLRELREEQVNAQGA